MSLPDLRFTSPSLPLSMSRFEVSAESSEWEPCRPGLFIPLSPLFFFWYCPFLKRSTSCISVKGKPRVLPSAFSPRKEERKNQRSLPPDKSSSPSRKGIVQHLLKCTSMSIWTSNMMTFSQNHHFSWSGVCPLRKKKFFFPPPKSCKGKKNAWGHS